MTNPYLLNISFNLDTIINRVRMIDCIYDFVLAIKIFEKKSMGSKLGSFGWCSFVVVQSGYISFNSILFLISLAILVRQLRDLILIIGLN